MFPGPLVMRYGGPLALAAALLVLLPPMAAAPSPGVTVELQMPSSINVTASEAEQVVSFEGRFYIDKPPGVTVDVTLSAMSDQGWGASVSPQRTIVMYSGNWSFSASAHIIAHVTNVTCTITVELLAQGLGTFAKTRALCQIVVTGPILESTPRQSMPPTGFLSGSIEISLLNPYFLASVATVLTSLSVAGFLWRRRRRRRSQKGETG